MTRGERLHQLRWARVERLIALGPRPPWYRPFKRRAWRKQYVAIRTVTVEEIGLMADEVVAAVVKAANEVSPMFKAIKQGRWDPGLGRYAEVEDGEVN